MQTKHLMHFLLCSYFVYEIVINKEQLSFKGSDNSLAQHKRNIWKQLLLTVNLADLLSTAQKIILFIYLFFCLFVSLNCNITIFYWDRKFLVWKTWFGWFVNWRDLGILTISVQFSHIGRRGQKFLVKTCN